VHIFGGVAEETGEPVRMATFEVKPPITAACPAESSRPTDGCPALHCAMAPARCRGAWQPTAALGIIALVEMIRRHAAVIGRLHSNVDMRTGSPVFRTPNMCKRRSCGAQIARRLKTRSARAQVTLAGGRRASDLRDVVLALGLDHEPSHLINHPPAGSRAA